MNQSSPLMKGAKTSCRRTHSDFILFLSRISQLQNPTKIIPLHKWSTARWRWRCCGRVWQMKRMCLTFLHACSDVLRCKTLRSSEICSYSTFGLGTYLPIAAKKTCLLSFDYIFPFIYSTHRVSFSFIFGPYKRQFK